MRRWAAARPLAVREAPSRQTSVWREACPPARRPRRELRSARRLEARPGPAGLAPPSDRATMTTGTATSIPTSFARRTPPDFRAAHPARLPCGAKPARPLADRAASFARRVASKPGQALQASRHSPVGPPPFGTADTSPAGLAPPPIGQSHPMSGTKLSPHETRRIEPVQNSPSRRPLWAHPGQNSPNTPQNGDTKPFLACRENFFTPTAEASRAGRTLYRTQDHLRDKTLPAQLISRSNGTKFSPLVIKRSFWPVLRMQGEFYPGYDIRGPQQGEFYPGILVALGLHPGSAMIIHVLLARQRP